MGAGRACRLELRVGVRVGGRRALLFLFLSVLVSKQASAANERADREEAAAREPPLDLLALALDCRPLSKANRKAHCQKFELTLLIRQKPNGIFVPFGTDS